MNSTSLDRIGDKSMQVIATGTMIDPTLYLVINPNQCVSATPVETALQAVRSGVTTVQLRNKSGADKHFKSLVVSTMEAIKPLGATVIVNDHVEVALELNTDGVHIGQGDMPVEQTRKMLGDKAVIGITVRNLDEVRNSALDLVDYVSIGGVFATKSKLDAQDPIGTEQLQHLVDAVRNCNSRIPIIAISGINQSNLFDVLSTGVSGVAVVSAICEADSPELAAKQLRKYISKFNSK